MTLTLDVVTRCSFCAKEQEEVAKMVTGAGVYICNECVALCVDIIETSKGEEQSSIPYWESMSDDELLHHLPRVAAVASQVEDNLRVWVHRTRERGVSWARVGEALGMTRQSAWERFSGED